MTGWQSMNQLRFLEGDEWIAGLKRDESAELSQPHGWTRMLEHPTSNRNKEFIPRLSRGVLGYMAKKKGEEKPRMIHRRR